MLENILQWDREMMVMLNMSGNHTIFLDNFMWMTTQIFIWIPVILIFIYLIFKTKNKKGFYVILAVALVFVLCDQVSSSILKPWIARLRPSRDPLVMNLLQYVNDYRGGQFGFPSSHAANSFGFAIFSSLLFKYKPYTIVVFLWALVCAYTRLYLGVHFPLDIAVGTILGLFLGYLCYFAYSKLPICDCEISEETHSLTKSGFEKMEINRLMVLLLVIFFMIIFFAYQQTLIVA